MTFVAWYLIVMGVLQLFAATHQKSVGTATAVTLQAALTGALGAGILLGAIA